jgi:hypothetical protein
MGREHWYQLPRQLQRRFTSALGRCLARPSCLSQVNDTGTGAYDRVRLPDHLPDHPQDVVQRIAVAVQIEQRGESWGGGAWRGTAGAGSLAAQ